MGANCGATIIIFCTKHLLTKIEERTVMVTKKKELKEKISGVLLTAILILTMMPWHVMADDTSAANAATTESKSVSNEAASATTRDTTQNKPAAAPAAYKSEKPLATSALPKKVVKTYV